MHFSVRFIIAGIKDVDGEGEELIIHKASVGCEKAEQKEEVSVGKEEVDSSSLELVVEQTKDAAKSEHDETMADVTEHDAEQEGERHD